MPKPEQIKELKTKVKSLVNREFQGSYRDAFDHYDALDLKNNKIDRKSLRHLLKDAKVGKPWTRGGWVEGVFLQLDSNRDSQISGDELMKFFDSK